MTTKADLLQPLTRPLPESAVRVNKRQNGKRPLLTGLHFMEGHWVTIEQTFKTLAVIAKPGRIQ